MTVVAVSVQTGGCLLQFGWLCSGRGEAVCGACSRWCQSSVDTHYTYLMAICAHDSTSTYVSDTHNPTTAVSWLFLKDQFMPYIGVLGEGCREFIISDHTKSCEEYLSHICSFLYLGWPNNIKYIYTHDFLISQLSKPNRQLKTFDPLHKWQEMRKGANMIVQVIWLDYVSCEYIFDNHW